MRPVISPTEVVRANRDFVIRRIKEGATCGMIRQELGLPQVRMRIAVYDFAVREGLITPGAKAKMHGPGRRIPPEVKCRVIELSRKGVSHVEIAETTGKTLNSVRKMLEAEVVTDGADQIDAVKKADQKFVMDGWRVLGRRIGDRARA